MSLTKFKFVYPLAPVMPFLGVIATETVVHVHKDTCAPGSSMLASFVNRKSK